jgi:hypothetical protein
MVDGESTLSARTISLGKLIHQVQQLINELGMNFISRY